MKVQEASPLLLIYIVFSFYPGEDTDTSLTPIIASVCVAIVIIAIILIIVLRWRRGLTSIKFPTTGGGGLYDNAIEGIVATTQVHDGEVGAEMTDNNAYSLGGSALPEPEPALYFDINELKETGMDEYEAAENIYADLSKDTASDTCSNEYAHCTPQPQ